MAAYLSVERVVVVLVLYYYYNICSGWFIGTWASPKNDEFLLGYLQYTNKGSVTTCSIQGFIIQFGGFASLMFNASLAIIYWLKTKHTNTWQESHVRHLQTKLQYILWTLSLMSAILPTIFNMYHNTGPICWIDASPRGCTQSWELAISGRSEEDSNCVAGDNATMAILGLELLPIWSCIIIDSVCMYKIYKTTKQLEQEPLVLLPSSTLRLGEDSESSIVHDNIGKKNNNSSRLMTMTVPKSSETNTNMKKNNKKRASSNIVAEQGMWYIAGFLATFGLTTLSVLIFLISGSWNLKIDRASYFFISLQGFWNMIIFTRRRNKKMKTFIGQKVRNFIWEDHGIIQLITDWLCCPIYCVSVMQLKINESDSKDHDDDDDGYDREEGEFYDGRPIGASSPDVSSTTHKEPKLSKATIMSEHVAVESGIENCEEATINIQSVFQSSITLTHIDEDDVVHSSGLHHDDEEICQSHVGNDVHTGTPKRIQSGVISKALFWRKPRSQPCKYQRSGGIVVSELGESKLFSNNGESDVLGDETDDQHNRRRWVEGKDENECKPIRPLRCESSVDAASSNEETNSSIIITNSKLHGANGGYHSSSDSAPTQPIRLESEAITSEHDEIYESSNHNNSIQTKRRPVPIDVAPKRPIKIESDYDPSPSIDIQYPSETVDDGEDDAN